MRYSCTGEKKIKIEQLTYWRDIITLFHARDFLHES